jgi:hypothetical protein
MRTVSRVTLLLSFTAFFALSVARAQSAAARAQDSTITLLEYRTRVPSGWTTRTPGSSMRLAEFVIRAARGADSAEVVVYFFGKGQGGTVDANLARWKAQFSTPDGSAVPEKVTRDSSGAFPITFAEYRGTYARGVGAGSSAEQARPGQILLAGIAETPRGTLFIQLFGPNGVVSGQHDALVSFVSGLR